MIATRPLFFTFVAQALASSSILNSSYVDIQLGQSQSNIEGYSKKSLQFEADQSYYPFGYERVDLIALAQWDAEHKTTSFQSIVQEKMLKYKNYGACASHWNISYVNSYNDYPVWTSLGALEADLAYGGTTGLNDAVTVFNFITEHGYISESDVKAGYLVGTKPSSVKLSSECNGKSLLGGVYWRNACPSQPSVTNDAAVNAVASGLYAVLGARLCRLTSNTTYCDYAYSTLQFMDRVLKTPNGLIQEGIDSATCKITPLLQQPHMANYLAAYADVGNYTKNETAIAIARNAAIVAMTTSEWNSKQGIIDIGAGSNVTSDSWNIVGPAQVVRWLQWSYGYYAADLQAAVLRYFNIQYWAITQLDADSKTQPLKYGRNWTGPGYEVVTNTSQNAALLVLNAITLNPSSAYSNSSSMDVPVAHTVGTS